jgi:hypothetical protein
MGGSKRWSVSGRAIWLSPQHQQAPVTKVAESGYDAKFRVRDPPRPAFMAQLPGRFRDMIESCDMRFSQQAAVSVER